MIFTPWFNKLGASILPLYNDLAKQLTGYEYFSSNFHHGKAMYPGEEWCNRDIPHAKWHVETAVALFDLAVLADEVQVIFKEQAGGHNENGGDGTNGSNGLTGASGLVLPLVAAVFIFRDRMSP